MSHRRTFSGSFLDPRGSLGVGYVGVTGKPADDAKRGLGDLSGLEITAGAKQNCLLREQWHVGVYHMLLRTLLPKACSFPLCCLLSSLLSLLTGRRPIQSVLVLFLLRRSRRRGQAQASRDRARDRTHVYQIDLLIRPSWRTVSLKVGIESSLYEESPFS